MLINDDKWYLLKQNGKISSVRFDYNGYMQEVKIAIFFMNMIFPHVSVVKLNVGLRRTSSFVLKLME